MLGAWIIYIGTIGLDSGKELMEPQPFTPEEIYEHARRIAMQFFIEKGLTSRHHLIEDATQEIALAGWQCSETTDQVGCIVNRMKDRLKTWWGRYLKEQSRRSSESTEGILDNETVRECEDRSRNIHDPEALKSFLETKLSPRQRQIANYFMAGFTQQQIAEELGMSDRTVQRERVLMEETYRRHLNSY